MSPNRAQVLGFAAMLLACATLWGISRVFLAAPCWALILLLTLVAWPVWVGFREYALYQHRVTLVAATEETSRIRRLFWRGSLTSNLQVFYAVFWAAALLVFSPLLESWRLALLAADVVVLSFAARWWRGAMAGEIRAEVTGTHSRRMVLWTNLGILATATFVIDYFFAGSPDTRGMAWNVLAERSFMEYSEKAACPVAGAAVGFANMADRLSWHGAEAIIPSLPDRWLILAAWTVFLLQAGALAYAYTRLQLGVLAIVDGLASKTGGDNHKRVPVLFPAFVALALLAAYALRGFDPVTLQPPVRKVAEWANPCRLAEKALAAMREQLGAEIEGVRKAQQQRADHEIDQLVEAVFRDIEKGVDAYLDWYFSLLGEYSRLGAWLKSQASNDPKVSIDVELEKRLFGDKAIGARLDAGNQRIAASTREAMSATALRMAVDVDQKARQKPCWADTLKVDLLPSVERDVMRAGAAGASGLVAGVATRSLIAGRLTGTVTARLAARPAFGSAAKVMMRMPAKRAGAIVVGAAGLAACAPSGPLALLCAVAAGAAAWVIVDEAMIKIDERRFREEMREELMGALRDQKEELTGEMKRAHAAYGYAMAQAMTASVDGVFIPVREGGAR